MSDYYVYVNWTHEYSMIHEANCSSCNVGRGIHSSPSGENDEWRGPFSTLEQAQAAANAGGYEVSLCQRCL